MYGRFFTQCSIPSWFKNDEKIRKNLNKIMQGIIIHHDDKTMMSGDIYDNCNNDDHGCGETTKLSLISSSF